MGQLRFLVPSTESYAPEIWQTAYVTGIEGIPWPGRITTGDNWFAIDRQLDESGKLSIVWPTSELGPTLLTTASLRCGSRSYVLPIELARGTLHRVRGRALDWQRLGLRLPEAFFGPADQGLKAFLEAVTCQNDLEESCRLSQVSIEQALMAMRPLTQAFVGQSLQARHQQESKLSTLFGAQLEWQYDWRKSAEVLLPAINMAGLPLEWGKIETDSGRTDYSVFDAQIEWARQNGLRISGGPLISLQTHAMPKWLYLLDNFESLLKAACDFVEKTVVRYRGRINLWSAAAGLNTPNELGLTDEELLRLAVGVIQTIRRTDDKTPVILTLDMPWAEYLGHREGAISPIHFADALVRADLGLSGLGLEMNMSYWPGGCLPHDLVAVSDLIDQWTMLGLPLMAMITCPQSILTDSKVNTKYSIVSQWKNEYPTAPHQSTGTPWTALELAQMLLAKASVHGIVWSQLSDRLPHAFANAGLFDYQGKPRVAFEALTQLRQQHIH